MKTNEDYLKQRVQRWIVTLSVLILGGKFLAFYLTNSVGILTDAMESIVNVLAGVISLYSLRWAAKPRDKEHPFGHGKIELISASIEGLLISMAGCAIIYEGVRRLFTPATIEKLDVGIIVVAVAGVINYLMGWYSIKIGKRYSSMALIAGGKHLQSDTYSTIGLVTGLILLYYTGIGWIDSALALIFGSIIILTGVLILRKTIANLLDRADTEALKEMAACINKHRQPDWIDIHNTKIIKYGSFLYIDCDLTLPWYYNVEESHQVCDKLRDTLVESFSDRIQLSVHSDPCRMEHCTHCEMLACTSRKEAFTGLENISLSAITESDEERNE
ncbi:cation diffusion facilitator family transporter [Bacteroides reticulotermitis]|uniref:Cation diffusion facilitator family transporter n=1 Tax=Bacteroides reticulotermitis TaxID=1133319 RepID=A0A840D2C4_9BACE|nr:cation diffusion facilitator family transporter [Bacteroides reticulotermitis]MBB4044959.1 cation diffusion facilitator family transporter [Bacteroides reticulotermitis]